MGLLHRLKVHAGQDAVEIFHHRHFGAETPPDGAEFEPDHAGADHDHLSRNFRQLQAAGRGDDDFFVNGHAGQRRYFGAGGDDDALGFENLFRAVFGGHFDLAGGGNRACAEKGVDLVLFQQEGDALHIGGDRVVLVLHHGGEIEFRLAGDDAERADSMGDLFKNFGSVQQGLGRNAADVEAGAAESLALFDNGGFQAELGGANGADIAARAGADDNEIV